MTVSIARKGLKKSILSVKKVSKKSKKTITTPRRTSSRRMPTPEQKMKNWR